MLRNRRKSEKNIYSNVMQSDVTFKAKVQPKTIAGKKYSQQFVPKIAHMVAQNKIGFGSPRQ